MSVYSFNGFIPVVHASSFIHPKASVTGNVIIGKDVYIGPGAEGKQYLEYQEHQ